MNMVRRFPQCEEANSIAFQLFIRIAGVRQLEFDYRRTFLPLVISFRRGSVSLKYFCCKIVGASEEERTPERLLPPSNLFWRNR